ncbi:MAG: Gfo/Idh/MocA family protein [Saccharofermentanales bacterium]
MEKLRIGILGGGGILYAHAPGFLRLKDKCEVPVIAEPDRAKHDTIRSMLGDDIEICDDYTQVLERHDINAVDILLPHHMHMPVTIAAAESGKHVLIEKVMARNIYECDRMIESCDKAGISLTVCHDRRYQPGWIELKDIIDSGELGEIFYWKLEHNQYLDLPAGHWIRSYDKLGGGAIISCLTHQIDALRWYGGEVDNIVCKAKVIPEKMEGEVIGTILADMVSGAFAQLSINWSTKSAGNIWYELVQVCGSKGEAYFNNKGTFLKTYDGRSKYLKQDPDTLDGDFMKVSFGNELSGHSRCIEEWVKSLSGGKTKVLTPGSDSRRTVEIAEAAYLSLKTGCRTKLPIDPKPWNV